MNTIGPNFLKKQFEILPPVGQNFQMPFLAYKQLKMAFLNSSPLVVEFQTKFYFKVWALVFKYIESSDHLELQKCDFFVKTFFFFRNSYYIRKNVNFGGDARPQKMPQTFGTLRHPIVICVEEERVGKYFTLPAIPFPSPQEYMTPTEPIGSPCGL